MSRFVGNALSTCSIIFITRLFTCFGCDVSVLIASFARRIQKLTWSVVRAEGTTSKILPTNYAINKLHVIGVFAMFDRFGVWKNRSKSVTFVQGQKSFVPNYLHICVIAILIQSFSFFRLVVDPCSHDVRWIHHESGHKARNQAASCVSKCIFYEKNELIHADYDPDTRPTWRCSNVRLSVYLASISFR